MTDSIENAVVSARLGQLPTSCCHSPALRMQSVDDASHPVRQFQTGLTGRSDQHEQTGY